jgi:hypothetical protein
MTKRPIRSTSITSRNKIFASRLGPALVLALVGCAGEVDDGQAGAEGSNLAANCPANLAPWAPGRPTTFYASRA